MSSPAARAAQIAHVPCLDTGSVFPRVHFGTGSEP
jgi:hypothetical protein